MWNERSACIPVYDCLIEDRRNQTGIHTTTIKLKENDS